MKTKAKHTPGPWRVQENYECKGIIHLAILAANNAMPASITPMRLRREEDNANARLMAAAPDLLEALKLAERAISTCRSLLVQAAKLAGREPDLDSELLDEIRVVIARAEGGAA